MDPLEEERARRAAEIDRTPEDYGEMMDSSWSTIGDAFTPYNLRPNDAEAAGADRNRRGDTEGLIDEGYAAERRARAENELSEVDRVMQDVPILDWLLGSDANAAEAQRRAEADINRAYWENLAGRAPSVGDLTANYMMERTLGGPGSEWENISAEEERGRGAMDTALSRMEEWASGGLTDADRAMMDETRRREGMGARADREASLAALEARGAGGGGSALAAMLSANEGAASRGASTDASMLNSAMNRATAANAAAASTAGSMRDADARRTAGREDYNRWDTEYRRDVNQRNTDRTNTEEDTRRNAEQQAYQNRERAVAGATNQYSTDASGARANLDAERESDRSLAGAIGSLLDF